MQYILSFSLSFFGHFLLIFCKFFELLSLFYGILCHFVCFLGIFLEFKKGFYQWLQLVNNFLDFPQNIQNANLGILPVYIFIYSYLTHTSLVPVEGIMTMIRAIKTDHDLDPERYPFGIHVV